jgi:hypothetical protein
MRRFGRLSILVLLTALLLPAARLSAQSSAASFYQRGTVYLDWNGSRYADGTFFNQVSARLRFELIDRPGQGWTLTLDARDRLGFRGETTNQVILYTARLTFDRTDSPFYLSVGQMNLFDTSGIGSLLGGLAGYKVRKNLLLGAYGGLESTPYIARLDTQYLKGGAFLHWTGPKGRSLSLSYNHLVYDGQTERQYAYANMFLPVKKILVFYGDAEYEMGDRVSSANRLSRLFGNVRVNLGKWADLTGSYSSGKGLDFHRYLIELSQDPTLINQDVERFYYTGYYGARLSVKPVPGLRLSIARQRSEQKDLGVVNATWRFGASVWNLFGRGLSLVGDYAMNRGDLSESDRYYVSLTKDFNRFSLTGSFSNSYRGLRLDTTGGEPQWLALDNSQNVSMGALIRLGRSLAVSLEYGGFLQSSLDEHFLFFRLIYRTR